MRHQSDSAGSFPIVCVSAAGSAVFLTGEAAATLAGSVAGPFIAQAAGLVAVAAAASVVTLSAAALAFLTVPPMPTVVVRRPSLPKKSPA
jgi:hypothetical protein